MPQEDKDEGGENTAKQRIKRGKSPNSAAKAGRGKITRANRIKKLPHLERNDLLNTREGKALSQVPEGNSDEEDDMQGVE